jgi:hypothetical protein
MRCPTARCASRGGEMHSSCGHGSSRSLSTHTVGNAAAGAGCTRPLMRKRSRGSCSIAIGAGGHIKLTEAGDHWDQEAAYLMAGGRRSGDGAPRPATVERQRKWLAAAAAGGSCGCIRPGSSCCTGSRWLLRRHQQARQAAAAAVRPALQHATLSGMYVLKALGYSSHPLPPLRPSPPTPCPSRCASCPTPSTSSTC